MSTCVKSVEYVVEPNTSGILDETMTLAEVQASGGTVTANITVSNDDGSITVVTSNLEEVEHVIKSIQESVWNVYQQRQQR